MPLILLGHQYCGKSTLGKHLACKFNKPWIDTDQALCAMYDQRYGKSLSCKEIFALHGDDFFRSLELEVILKMDLQKHPVISLGGGSLCSPSAKEYLQTKGCLLWIVCSKQVLRTRTLQNLPAFFSGKDFESTFEKRFQERERIFKSLQAIKIFMDR